MDDVGQPEPRSPSIGDLPTIEGGGLTVPDPRGISTIERELERVRAHALLGLEAPPPRFGRFVVEQLLGRGGMGVVLAAHDPQLDRRVALKLLDDAAATASSQAAVLREARSLARLSHPNVVAVYEVGDVDGVPYIAMELVEGITLRAWLEGGLRAAEPEDGAAEPEDGEPLPPEQPNRIEVLKMFLAVGQGLQAAHDAGIVHHDFKPDNVLVGTDGRPRILDFGLSRTQPGIGRGIGPGIESGDPDEPPEPDRHAAAAGLGTTAGTPAYMAPEQWLGVPSDARTDVFSYCVALFEALYELRPFEGETLTTLMAQVTAGQPREVPSSERVDASLHAAILRGLARDPDERWPSMAGVVEAVREALARMQPGLLRASPTIVLRVVAPLNIAIPVVWLTLEGLGVVAYRPLAWLYLSGAQIVLLALLVVLARRLVDQYLRTRRVLLLPQVAMPLLLAHRIATLVMGSSIEAMFVYDYLVIASVAWTVVLALERGMWPMMLLGTSLAVTGMLVPSWSPRLWVVFIAGAPFLVFYFARRASALRDRAIGRGSSHSRSSRTPTA